MRTYIRVGAGLPCSDESAVLYKPTAYTCGERSREIL